VKLITTLDQHELGLTDPADSDINRTRFAARAVLHNDKGQVAIMHFTKNGSYKLPGGGIDKGESIEAALRREIREETGYEITNVLELGIVEEDRYIYGMHQTSYCFTATIGKFVGTELTEKEAAQGMELVWFDSIDEAIVAIESASGVDEDDSPIGLEMMKRRDVAILNEAKEARLRK
jgi:8-oxo-dGTP diphosphatase